MRTTNQRGTERSKLGRGGGIAYRIEGGHIDKGHPGDRLHGTDRLAEERCLTEGPPVEGKGVQQGGADRGLNILEVVIRQYLNSSSDDQQPGIADADHDGKMRVSELLQRLGQVPVRGPRWTGWGCLPRLRW